MITTLLIDGDPVAFRAALFAKSADAAIDWACRKVDRWLGSTVCGDRAIVCFSCHRSDCFRRDVDPTYKTKSSDTPEHLHATRDGLRSRFVSRELPRLEADDVLGILATHPNVEGRKVIVADDKDLLQIPGLHSRPLGEDRIIVEVSPGEADRAHLLQTLIGDTTDGYPGCPGIGEKRAAALLAGVPLSAAWPVIVKSFRGKGLSEADALKQARLARVLRATDYEIDARKVRLWEPREMVRTGEKDAARF